MLLNFMQNDDWVYYKMVESFLNGNFSLDPISAPTFYTQGILAFLFSRLFGLVNLPYLTLFISFLCFILFVHILKRFYIKSMFLSFILGLLLIFNPWFLYSSIGFMTENYFLFFTLLNIYLFLDLEDYISVAYSNKNSNSKKYNYQGIIKVFLLFFTITLSFLLRQVAMVFPIALGIYWLLTKNYKFSFISILYFVFLYSFYVLFFPRTAEMFEKPLQFQHILDFKYSFSLIYASLIVLCATFLPLFLNFIFNNFLINHIKDLKIKSIYDTKLKLFLVILLIFISSVVIYFTLNNNFHPRTVSWGEFPYLENTWERTGLYPRGVIGTKYQFKWNYDLYYYWDLMSKIVISVFISYILLFFKKSKLIEFSLIFIVLYFGIMLLTETFYDRYLLVLLPFVIIFFAKFIKQNIFEYIILLPFIVFLGFYSYQLTMDFILVNSYIWNRSNNLVVTEGIEPKMVQGTNAWKLNYKNIERNYIYDFSYDSQVINPEYKTYYDLVEIKEIEYPLNIFIEPKIYLYKKK